MDEPVIKEKPKLRWVTHIAGVYLVLLYIGLIALVLLVGDKRNATETSPTPTVPPVTDPRILVHQPAKNITVTHEDFSANRREWGLYYYDGKLEVIKGKLVLQSYGPNGIAIGINQRIAPVSEKYYIQADFSSDIETDSGYGLVFGFNQSLSTFYLFEVWPQSKQIGFFEYNAGKWTELIPFTQAEVNS